MTTVTFNPFAGGELLRVAPTTGPQREIIASAQISDVANTAFNEAVSVRLVGELDQERLHHCFVGLIARHDILRATFSRNGTDLCLHETSPFELEYEDISNFPEAAQESAISDLWRNIAISPMNLEEGPLIFAWLKRLDSHTHELTIAAHHIICDGWSIGLILEELANSYQKNGEPHHTADPDISFFDYAELVDSREISNVDNDYWINGFAKLPPSLDLPLDYPRPSFRSFEATRLDYQLDSGIAKQLPKAAAAMKVSLVNMVLAGYFVLLHRLTGNDDIVVGLPVAGQATQNRLKQIGQMVHLLPIRTNLTPETRFSDLCQQVKSAVLNATEHSNFTFGKLIEALNVDRTRVPLISTIFNIDQPLESIAFGDLNGQIRTVPRAAENFEMFLNILPSPNNLTVEATYSTVLFSEATIISWLAALEEILSTVTANSDITLGSIPLAQQEPEAIKAVNNTITDSTHSTVIDAFRYHVDETPDKIACVFDGQFLTYRDLENRSNLIASTLTGNGITSGDIVAVCAGRSEASLLSVIGIMKLGAVYLPLDPEFPDSRLQYMIEDSGATAILIDESTPTFIADLEITTLNIHPVDKGATSAAVELKVEPEQIAYIIYTSGSTGKPKGVLIQHKALMNFLGSMACRPGCVSTDKLLAVTTFSFDISILELLLPVSQGATIVIANQDSTKDGDKLRSLILDHEITILQATPATWRMLLDTQDAGNPWQPNGMRMKGLCGGEPLPQDLMHDLSGSLYELWNMYGPTETTIWSTCHKVGLTDALITVGKPIDNTHVHILDEAQNPLPLSCPGELYIGGQGLAKGYHKRPELTAEKYVDHPIYGRIYATGDLAKWCPDGTILHLGRMDDQVKVRGYRIELGDIETALTSSPGVKAACAYVWEISPGDVRLVACLVLAEASELNTAGIRKELRKQLPSYMIPQYFLSIENIPLSPSGKVDRKKLPKPELRESSILKASALANQTEELIAEVWSDVLNSNSRIVREDNFFNLGGHSLLALQAIRKIETQTNIRLAPQDIVSLSLSEIAEKLSNTKPVSADHNEESPADLPPAQHRLLSNEQNRLLMRQLSYPDNVCNNLPASWLLTGTLDINLFEKSLARVFERQTALRTVITQHKGRYLQSVIPIRQTPVLEIVDLTEDENSQDTALALSKKLAFGAFRVLDQPLFRSTLFLLGESRYLYAFVPHQLIFDGWSFDIFLKELETAYLVQSNVERETPNKLAFEFRDFAEWSVSKGAVSEDIDYHKARLSKLLDSTKHANSDSDYHHDSAIGGADGQCRRETLAFSESVLAGVESSAQKLGLRLHELLFCLLSETVYQAQKRAEIILGVPTTGRHRADTINLIGSFVSIIPCQLQAVPSGFQARIVHFNQQLKEALDHQNVTYADIIANTPDGQAMFPDFIQASFAFQDIRNRPTSIAGLALKQIDLPRFHTEYPVEFWVRIQPDGFIGVFDYNEALVGCDTVQSLKTCFSELITGIDGLLSEASLETATPDISIRKKPFWRKLFQ